jgi:hypothetical protein
MSASPKGRGGRSRIVIDVDKVRQESRARRGFGAGRGVRALTVGALVALGLVAALLAGSFIWWNGYKKSPEYSLALLVDAAQRDDLRAVEQLMDGDGVAQALAPQVGEKLAGTAPAGVDVNAHRARIAAAMPQLMPRVREGVRDEVARGVKAAAEGVGARLPFFALALGMKRYADVTEEGDAAAVTLNAVEGRPLALSMRRDGERWKVAGITDDALAASMAARIAPAISAPPAAPAPTPRPAGRRRPRN